MSGITAGGIRYPDAASRASNLGPELKRMAEDIEVYVEETAPSAVQLNNLRTELQQYSDAADDEIREAHDRDTYAPEAARRLLELAEADGWLAVYDPTNPKTRTFQGDRLSELRDGLGNLPPLRPTNPQGGPRVDAGAFGAFAGINFPGTAEPDRSILTEQFNKNQPTFVLSLGRDRTGVTPTERSRFLYDGVTSAGRNALLVGPYETPWTMYAQSERSARDTPMDSKTHVFGVRFDGTSSQFFIDGIARYWTGGGALTAPMSGLRIGNRFIPQTGNQWDGWAGPILIYDGVPSAAVRDRMTRFLMGVSAASGLVTDQLNSESAVYRSATTTEFDKDADTVKIPASLTKLLTGYVAREVISDARLDELVTITSADSLAGSAPQLYVGDQISYRDLLYLTMLPSHNAAARIVARAVGEQMSGGNPSMMKFLARMNSLCTIWGWEGANFQDAAGLNRNNRMSANQVADLLFRIHASDPTMVGILGTLTRDISVQGPRARSITATHTINPNGAVEFPEWIGGKTGSLTQMGGNLGMLVQPEGGPVMAVVTMVANPHNARYPDARSIMDGRATVTRSASAVMTDIDVAAALNDAGSLARHRLDNLYEPRHSNRSPIDIGDRFPDIDLSLNGAAVTLHRAGQTVELSIAAVRLPAEFTTTAAIPVGYRPARFAYGLTRNRSDGNVSEVQVTPSGSVNVAGNAGSDVLRASLTWITNDSDGTDS